jgi:hypothetical protein
MNRLLEYLKLKSPPDEETITLAHETREVRHALERVGDKLSDVAAALHEASVKMDASNIPMEDMIRGRQPRRTRRELE